MGSCLNEDLRGHAWHQLKTASGLPDVVGRNPDPHRVELLSRLLVRFGVRTNLEDFPVKGFMCRPMKEVS